MMPKVHVYTSRGYELVGTSGLEPPTPTMSRWCSNQLSYAPSVSAGFYIGQWDKIKAEQT